MRLFIIIRKIYAQNVCLPRNYYHCPVLEMSFASKTESSSRNSRSSQPASSRPHHPRQYRFLHNALHRLMSAAAAASPRRHKYWNVGDEEEEGELLWRCCSLAENHHHQAKQPSVFHLLLILPILPFSSSQRNFSSRKGRCLGTTILTWGRSSSSSRHAEELYYYET